MRQALKIVLTALAGVMMLAASCVKEDRSDCPPEDVGRNDSTSTSAVKRLNIKFVPRQMDITPSPADLQLAVVYIFDSEGTLFQTWDKNAPSLDTTYDTGISLGSDTYRIVAWLNPTEPFNLSPEYIPVTRSDFEDARVTMTIPGNDTITPATSIPMLMYGYADRVIAPTTDTVIDIPLTLDVYKIELKLGGVPRDGSEYEIRITDTNGSYDFDNNVVNTQSFTYIASAAAPGDGIDGTVELNMSLTTLRLEEGRSPRISIVNKTTGKTIFPQNGATSVDLMDLVRQTGINLGSTHRLNIDVNIGEGGTTATPGAAVDVYINGWHVVFDDYNIIN